MPGNHEGGLWGLHRVPQGAVGVHILNALGATQKPEPACRPVLKTVGDEGLGKGFFQVGMREQMRRR